MLLTTLSVPLYGEEGKTSIKQHKSAVYNGSRTGGLNAAFSHNNTTGGGEPCWLDTFGSSQFHSNSEVSM